MSSTRDKKRNAGTVVDGAVSRSVPQTKPKQQPPATDVDSRRAGTKLRAPIAAAAADKKPRADAGTPQRSKATDKHMPPSANGTGHGGGSTSTGASAGTTGPYEDRAMSGLVPPAKAKQNKEKSKNQN